jgi:hypothetical protein
MEWNVGKTLNLVKMYRERPLLMNSCPTDYKYKNKHYDDLF